MFRQRDRTAFGELRPDLYVVSGPRRLGRPVKHDVGKWCIVDDWLAHVPVMDAELDGVEACFGGL